MKRIYCPSCEQEITSDINFRGDCTEYGRYVIDIEDNFNGELETDDNSGIDNITYSCPECDNEIDIEQIIVRETNEEGDFLGFESTIEDIQEERHRNRTLTLEQKIDEILEFTKETPNPEAFSEEEAEGKTNKTINKYKGIKLETPERQREIIFTCKFCKESMIISDEDIIKGIQCKCKKYITFGGIEPKYDNNI